MMIALEWFIGNSMVLQLTMTDEITGAAVTDATVTTTMYDPDGEEVVGQAWPITLTHAGAGVYRAIPDPDIEVAVGHKKYSAVIDGEDSDGNKLHCECDVIVKVRKCGEEC